MKWRATVAVALSTLLACAHPYPYAAFERLVSTVEDSSPQHSCADATTFVARGLLAELVSEMTSAQEETLASIVDSEGRPGSYGTHEMRTSLAVQALEMRRAEAALVRIAKNDRLAAVARYQAIDALSRLGSNQLGSICDEALREAVTAPDTAALMRCVLVAVPDAKARLEAAARHAGRARPAIAGLYAEAIALAEPTRLTCVPEARGEVRGCTYACPLGLVARDWNCPCDGPVVLAPSFAPRVELDCRKQVAQPPQKGFDPRCPL